MSYLRSALSHNFKCVQYCFRNSFISNTNNSRHFCEAVSNMSTEKSINKVTLLGRVGINPQLRGTECKPVVVFTLATNTNYKYDSGDIQQKTDWHKICVFKPYLRNMVLEYLKKGNRVYIEGRILYGEFSDSKGVMHNSTSIIANDIVFLGIQKKSEEDIVEEMENSTI